MLTTPATGSQSIWPTTSSVVITALVVCFSLALVNATECAEWYVLCESSTGRVVVAQTIDPGQHITMDGPFPGQTTATIWIEENCPGQRCNDSGACVAGDELNFSDGNWIAACDPSAGEVVLMQTPLPEGFLVLDPVTGRAASYEDPDSASSWISETCPSWECNSQGRCADPSGGQSTSGGWVAGEITSIQHGSTTPTTRSPVAGGPPTNPAETSGPQDAGLQSLVDNALAAADACSDPAGAPLARTLKPPGQRRGKLIPGGRCGNGRPLRWKPSLGGWRRRSGSTSRTSGVGERVAMCQERANCSRPLV